ncbi:hypothetical protein B0H19DRAFT_929217 [Mycena capillaripes]|nr:hypothetical protein B0H19DRAFT_929217 [Mycena capillaripes]
MPAASSSESSSAPELTILTRVASIPLISCALKMAHENLANNRYTSSPYSAAKDLSASAYTSASKYTAPLTVRLAPVIKGVDGYANKACDVMQHTFPYPFEAQPEDVANYVRQSRQSAVDYVADARLNANKTLDERVKTPAVNVACEVDKRFTPLVDYLECTAANRLHTSTAPVDTKFQYQRAYLLSKNVTGQLYEYSNQTVLVQRASQTADSINALASSANTRIHSLSDSLICELQRVQASLADHTTAASRELNDTISALRDIVGTRNLTLNEKVVRISDECQFRARPVLTRIQGEIQSRARPLLNLMHGAQTPPAETATGNGHANGHAK